MESIEAEINFRAGDKGAIDEAPGQPDTPLGYGYHSIFTVPEADGKLRPCSDQRPFTLCIRHYLWMGGLHTRRDLWWLGDSYAKARILVFGMSESRGCSTR